MDKKSNELFGTNFKDATPEQRMAEPIHTSHIQPEEFRGGPQGAHPKVRSFTSPLEPQTHAEGARAGRVETRHLAYVGDDPDRGQRADVDPGVRPVRMVEEVRRRKFPAEARTFAKCEALCEADVPDVGSRPFDHAFRRAPEEPGGRWREGGRVNPAAHRALA